MVPIVRSFVSVPAGVVKMPWAQFLAYTTLGSLIELRSPDLLPHRRAWPPHPACACRTAGPR
ncbi:hypothetical protein GCM10023162_38050 [Klenkia terrae]